MTLFTGSAAATMDRSHFGNVVLDADGNIYGTTVGGGAYGNGVVWEITP